MRITIEQLRDGRFRVLFAQDGRETVEVAQSRLGAVKAILSHLWGKRSVLVLR